MKKLFINFLIILFSFTSIAYAGTPSTDLGGLLNSLQSMKANFTQTVYNNRGKATQKSFGQMAMQRPGKFRWDVKKPIPQLIIANQSKLWIYDHDLAQVTVRSLQKATGDSPAVLLSHDTSTLEKNYVVKTIDRDTSEWRWFSLTPKKRENMFTSIQMGFTNNQVKEMRLQDNLGHNTVIQFQNAQINPSLSASLFTFKPNAKVDVIDETRKK